MNAHLFATNLVDSVINNATNNVINKSFYLIKYSTINNSYISSEVLYANIIGAQDIVDCTIKDILYFTSKNLKTILPIPILNGKYLSENLFISKLPSKLIIIFANMNILTNAHTPLSINNTTALNYIMNMLGSSTTTANPPPPAINNIAETFITEESEKYKDEIKILKNMGFTNLDKIIESLIVNDGDVNSAVHYYLN